MDEIPRRDFLKIGGAALAAGTIAASEIPADAQASAPFAAPAIEHVRIGFVGIGGQGAGHVENLLRIPGCQVTAVCDIRPERTEWASRQIVEAGHRAPASYTRGPRDFERLCATEDLDLVFNATPWEWHVADHAVSHDAREAHRDRSAGGDDASTTAGPSSSRRRSTGATA